MENYLMADLILRKNSSIDWSKWRTAADNGSILLIKVTYCRSDDDKEILLLDEPTKKMNRRQEHNQTGSWRTFANLNRKTMNYRIAWSRFCYLIYWPALECNVDAWKILIEGDWWAIKRVLKLFLYDKCAKLRSSERFWWSLATGGDKHPCIKCSDHFHDVYHETILF